ncbi:MAG TPA: hypothetical protein V6C65_05995 [Allocoleopsis sp.]
MMDALNENSYDEQVSGLIELGYDFEKQDDPDKTVRIFRGYVQDLGPKVGLARPAVQTGCRILYAMRAATVLKVASPKAPSVILISYTPTEKDYDDFLERSETLGRRIAPTRTDAVFAELKELRNRMAALENMLGVTNRDTEILDGRIDGTNLRGS